MKRSILFFTLLAMACTRPEDPETEKSAITKLIDDETRYAAAADLPNQKKCWSTDEAMFTFSSAEGAQQFQGWDAIESLMKEAEPFELKMKRDNYQFTIDDNVAFVSFDQQDNWGGTENRKTKETRVLKKIDNEWKIVNVNVINMSSFENKNTGSYHIAKEKIPVDPKTSFRNTPGLGGMFVGYVEVPAGTDFTPLFQGLPHNMCTSPHWGYLLEGSIRVKYADGKEETVKGGEVFYWPAPHTAAAEKNVKFIDFSPEPQFNEVMTHISKKMAEPK